MWDIVPLVGGSFSLLAFVVAIVLAGYRARLKNQADIIKSATAQQRLDAIAISAAFFKVDVGRLPPEQQQAIVLAQISQRSRRDLMLIALLGVVAVLMAIVAVVGIARPTASPAAEGTKISLQRRSDDDQCVFHIYNLEHVFSEQYRKKLHVSVDETVVTLPINSKNIESAPAPYEAMFPVECDEGYTVTFGWTLVPTAGGEELEAGENMFAFVSPGEVVNHTVPWFSFTYVVGYAPVGSVPEPVVTRS